MDELPRNVEPAEESPVGLLRQGGTAKVLLPQKPACLNPYLPECEGAKALIGTVLEAPLAVGPGLSYKPLLAERMPSYEAGTLSLEPLTVEIRLRSDLTFSDGEPLTSADVKWTYEQAIRLAEKGDIALSYAGFDRVSRVEAPDDRTVRLIFDEPYALWRDLLTAPILPQHVYEGRNLADSGLNRQPVGSGPFVLEDWTEKISLTENRDYWSEEPLPNLEGMDIMAPSPVEAADSLSGGRADFGFFATARTLPDSGELLRAAAAPVRVETLLFNSRNLDSVSRTTLSRAVYRERVAGESGAQVARSFVPPEFVPGYTPAWKEPSRAIPQIPQSAEISGETLDLVYVEQPNSQLRDGIVEILISDLSDAGIKVEPRPLPPGVFFGKVLPAGDFDLALLTLGTPAEYEALLPSLPPKSRETLAQTLGTPDAEERAETLARAQREMFGQAALLPLFVWPDTMAWSSTLSGPRPDTPYRGLMSNAREWAFYK